MKGLCIIRVRIVVVVVVVVVVRARDACDDEIVEIMIEYDREEYLENNLLLLDYKM